MKKKPAKKPGAPKAKLNLAKIRNQAAEFCTIEEIAASSGVSGRTLLRRKEDPEVLQALDEGKAKGKASLRALLWKMAKRGNTAVAIFLSKQKTILGYTDKCEVEHGGHDGKPIKTEMIIRFVEAGEVPAEPDKPPQPEATA